MSVSLGWIEVPVQDIERASKFYSQVFGLEGKSIADDGTRRTVTLTDEDAALGLSLNQTANFEPSDKGVYLYYSAGDDMDAARSRVVEAGGTLVTEKIAMGDAGYYCSVKDTEGNLFGLWADK